VCHTVVGSQIPIDLIGNPTTGYEWQLAEMDGTAVEQEGEIVYDPDRASGKVGAGGAFVARFRAVRPGRARARMEYVRPWEKNVPPAKVLVIDFDVRAR
jgi:inhibitor of cysteine peptidase